MSKYFIDGSAKGLTMGYGIVEVDQIGFMKLHEGYSMHPMATANFAELYALEETLKRIASNVKANENYTINLDQTRIVRLFNHTIENGEVKFKAGLPVEDNEYISRIRKQFVEIATSIMPNGTIEVRKIACDDLTPAEIIYENTAHKLSRSYFGNVDALFLDEDSPLKEKSVKAKVQINRFTKAEDIGFIVSPNGRVNLDVVRDGDMWLSYYGGKEVVKSKNLVNVVLFSIQNINSEVEGTDKPIVGFFSESNLFRSIQNSVGYPNCPEDIRNKGNEILELASKGKIKLVKKD